MNNSLIQLSSDTLTVNPLEAINSNDQIITKSMSHDHEKAMLDISSEKLAMVIGITFSFILLLLLSLICVFYLMGFLQNVFGYSWSRPMGRTFSTVHSNHSISTQDIFVDNNSNICEKTSSTSLPIATHATLESEQCYVCTAIACNTTALGSPHVSQVTNIRSC